MADQRCNATLNGMKCGKYGHPDGTLHRHKHEPAADRGCYAAWTDGFPEAKPHVEPVPAVTDVELTAAMHAWMDAGGPRDRRWSKALSQFRAALAAAYAIHDEDRLDVNGNPLHDWHWCVDEQEVHHVADVCTYPQGRHDLYVTRFPIDKEQTDE